jgi:uncharacterized protein with HEPN domain
MSTERKWKFRVEHILEAIRKIDRYTASMTEESFQTSEITVDAVIRNFQIVGEAARKIPDDVQQSYPEIPWSLMQGMRHVLVHAYDAVKLDVVWRTIQQDLPALVEPLTRILDSAEE